jgi:arsenate reductase (thioredoxin)
MAALLQRAAHGGVVVRSAGSSPGEEIHPAVRAAMSEMGIDLNDESPKLLTEGSVREADVVITMGCGDACPVFPGKVYLDWDLEDPAEKPIEVVRAIGDEIAERVQNLLKQLARPEQGSPLELSSTNEEVGRFHRP